MERRKHGNREQMEIYMCTNRGTAVYSVSVREKI